MVSASGNVTEPVFFAVPATDMLIVSGVAVTPSFLAVPAVVIVAASGSVTEPKWVVPPAHFQRRRLADGGRHPGADGLVSSAAPTSSTIAVEPFATHSRLRSTRPTRRPRSSARVSRLALERLSPQHRPARPRTPRTGREPRSGHWPSLVRGGGAGRVRPVGSVRPVLPGGVRHRYCDMVGSADPLAFPNTTMYRLVVDDVGEGGG